MKPEELLYVRPPRRGGECEMPEDKDPPGRAGASADAAPLDMQQVLNFPVPSEARLRELFGLTAAEARFAQLLACGDSVEEVAEKLGIKLTTARSKLAVIFSKTQTRRQTKLVALLSRIAHLA